MLKDGNMPVALGLCFSTVVKPVIANALAEFFSKKYQCM